MFDRFSPAQVPLVVIFLLCVRWIARGFYRVYFHPLSGFPGPKISAFTRIPHLLAISKGVLPKYSARLHEQYGDVVRISPDELSFSNAQAWRDIYGHGSKGGQGSAPRKNLLRYVRSVNGSPSLLITGDDGEHGRVRKIFSAAFSDRALTAQEPLFTRYADKLVALLKEKAQEDAKIDMVRMYNFTTFDIMGDLTFGESLHMLDNAEYDPWVRIIFKYVKQTVMIGLILYYYPLAARLVKKVLQKTMLAQQYEHFNYSATRVTKRLEKGRASEGVDLWDMILKNQEIGKTGLTRGEMDSNAGLFMTAGTETTATLLSGLTHLLLAHPDSMGKLVKEIRTTFPSSDSISMEALAALPYLNACIKEGFRKYPPVPTGFPRITPHEGSTICGQFIPPGTTVSIPQLATYTSPTLFRDPHSFIPERWTGDDRFASDDRAALQPFSIGTRDCIGKNMAYHEIRLLLAKVLYNFDLELCEESRGWDDQAIFLFWEKKPLVVRARVVE